MQKFLSHHRKILAYLGLSGHKDVLSVGQIGYSHTDNTLRLHDGCTCGGFVKLALTEKTCNEVEEGFDFASAPKGSPRSMRHDISVGTSKSAVQAAVVEFNAQWPAVQEEPIAVKFNVTANELILREDAKGKQYIANVADSINARLGQYGIQAASAGDDALFELKSQLALRGPDALGSWNLTLTNAEGVTFKAAAVKQATKVETR